MDSLKASDISRLIDAIQGGTGADVAFAELAGRYMPLMQSRAVAIVGEPSEEAVQEARIALHKAAVTYRSDKCDGVSFGLYAGVCISNALRTFCRVNRRNSMHVCLDSEGGEDTPDSQDIEALMATKDLSERVLRAAKFVLSGFEYEVFRLGFEGYTTADIAACLSKTAKAVDNAKNRIFKKLRAYFSKHEEI